MCNKPWLTVLSADFEEDDYKWARCGYHELNKVYVMFGTNYPGTEKEKVIGLEIFEVDSLQNFGKEGKVLIGSREGAAGKWRTEAYFIVEKGVATQIELSVQAVSDPKPNIQRIAITLGRKVESGQITVVQDNSAVYNPSDYTVPTPVSKGPTITLQPQTKLQIPEVKCTGETPLEITVKVLPEPDQSSEKNGKFDNEIYLFLHLFNKGNTQLVINKVTGEYCAKDGTWTSLKTLIGSRSGFYNYSWNRDDPINFKMGALDQVDRAFRLTIPVESPQNDKQRRVHKSLPQPLKVRLTFDDAAAGKYVAEIEVANEQLELVTKESRLKIAKLPLVFYTHCDDDTMDCRIFTEVIHNEKEKKS